MGTAIAPVRDNVDELSGQIWQEGQVADRRHEKAMAGQEETRAAVTAGKDEVLAAITQDKISATLEELARPDADPALLAEFERVIRIAKERNLPITEEQAAGIAETAARMGRSNRPGDDEIARLIEQGDYRGAARRKAELARSRIEETKKQEAAELRDAATLALPFAPSEARDYLAQATELDPTDLWSWIELGRLRMAYDSLSAARQCFGAALQQVTGERDRMALHNEFGDVLMAEGQLGDARSEYETGLVIAERLAQLEPGNAGWQHDLSVSYEMLGNVEQAAGNLAAARTHYEAGLAIRERLAQQEPGNAGWQRDLSVSYNKLGEVEQAAGSSAAARTRYEAGFAIAERLAQQEPGNAEWQRDLSVSYDRLGNVEQAAGNLAAARTRYEAGLAIRERLAQQEPGNAGWQRDLSVSYDRLGNVEQAAGNLAAARTRYEAAFAIRERLAQKEPGNAEWQRDLWVSNGKLGQLAMLEGTAALALAHFREAERVMAALAARWPDHPGFAGALATVQNYIARVEGGDSGQG